MQALHKVTNNVMVVALRLVEKQQQGPADKGKDIGAIHIMVTLFATAIELVLAKHMHNVCDSG